MSISSVQLEALSDNLHRLAGLLQADSRPADTELSRTDPLVVAAENCDFILPSPLTTKTLAATVQKKIENVAVLLERSLMHESLPPEAQAAAEEENKYIEENYQDNAASAADQPAGNS